MLPIQPGPLTSLQFMEILSLPLNGSTCGELSPLPDFNKGSDPDQMTHRGQPGTRGSPGASKAARLSTPEWAPGKNLGLYLPSETAPAPDEALVDKKKEEQSREGRN